MEEKNGRELTGVPAGGTVTIEAYMPYNASITGYYKKNLITGQFVDIAQSITTTAGGKTKITFNLTNNDDYDEDSDLSKIKDPGGPGYPSGSGGTSSIASPRVTNIPALSDIGIIVFMAFVFAVFYFKNAAAIKM
ncbi:MAG: hypothetical protein HQK77_03085 [Desulfobacterales bacterium]|nr:hypothetical protein [Desulfobacterales bacterium]